jgi:hypothetical protein
VLSPMFIQKRPGTAAYCRAARGGERKVAGTPAPGQAQGKIRLISGAGEAGTSKSSLPAWLAGGSGTSRTRYQLSTLVP